MTLTDAPPVLAPEDLDDTGGAPSGHSGGARRDDHVDAPPPSEPRPPTAEGSPWRDRFHVPTRSGWITLAIAALAAGLYTWGLAEAGVANSYYTAAVKSMSESWKAFFYGSIDAGSFITVDKPPAALWLMALSARLFGFSTWSMLLPQAAAGVGSVLILHRLVREWMGDVAAHLAALALAVTPVAVVMFRYNNPDALLTLLCLVAAWALWAALKDGRTRLLVLSMALIGLAFNTKMMQAFVVLPALVGVYLLFGPPKLGKRLWQLALAGVALLVSAGWWVAIVALVPAASRPYIGSTDDNSIISLVLGYNGLERVLGGDGGGPTGGGPAGGGGPNFGGAVGWLRMFNPENGGQIAWLIPLALLGLGAGLWLTRRPSVRPAGPSDAATRAAQPLDGTTRAAGTLGPVSRSVGGLDATTAGPLGPASHSAGPPDTAHRTAGRLDASSRAAGTLGSPTRADLVRAGWYLWGGWALVTLAVFSFAEGIFHPYYSVQLAPALAALAGGGAIALWQLGRRHPAMRWLLPATVVVTAGVAVIILERTPDFAPWLSVAIVAGAALGAAGLWFGATLRLRTLTLAAAAVAGVTLLAGPTAYSLTTIANPQSGSLASAGPTSATDGFGPDGGAGGTDGGTDGGPGGASTSIDGDTDLVAYLEANQGDATWLVAAFGSQSSASIILATDEPVMTIGGFNGGDPAPTLEEFVQYVERGEVRYVLVSGGGLGGPGGGGPGGGSGISSWVTANGTVVDADADGGSTTGTLYDLAGVTGTDAN